MAEGKLKHWETGKAGKREISRNTFRKDKVRLGRDDASAVAATRLVHMVAADTPVRLGQGIVFAQRLAARTAHIRASALKLLTGQSEGGGRVSNQNPTTSTKKGVLKTMVAMATLDWVVPCGRNGPPAKGASPVPHVRGAAARRHNRHHVRPALPPRVGTGRDTRRRKGREEGGGER